MKKAFFLLTLVIMSALFLAGCRGAPLPINFDEFEAAARDAGFAVTVDANIIHAVISENSFVKFEQLGSIDAARSRFNSQEVAYRAEYSSFSSSTSVSMPSHASWRFRAGGRYHVIYWIGTGFLQAESPNTGADRRVINDFLDIVIRRY